MNFPYRVPFTLRSLDDWITLHQPLAIEMTDHQYAWLANLMMANVKSYAGISIHFTDAPVSK